MRSCRKVVMERITIQRLNEIVRDRLREAGCMSAEVRVQRFYDPAIPCNWGRSDFINYRDDGRFVVERALSRIIPELQSMFSI
jgi:hypothetical protein